MLDWRTPRYVEQLERIKRWRARVQDQNRPQQEYLDDLQLLRTHGLEAP
jgi:hypothetical protein